MNFANQLMASAEKAASAAKNFKGFDEMAEEDDYIHSEGLNVKNRSRETKQLLNDNDNRNATDEANESHASPEPSWSLLDRPTTKAAEATSNNRNAAPIYSRNSSTISSASPASSISPPRQRPPFSTTASPNPPQQDAKKASSRGGFSKHRNQAQQQQQSPSNNASSSRPNPYLSVVADALQDGSSVSKSDRRPSLSGYDTDNEDGSSSDSSSASSSSSEESDYGSSDEEEDPILSQIKQSKKKKASRKQRRKKERKKQKKKKQARKEQKKKKNPHRFLEDLDQRGGMAATMEFAQQHQQQPSSPLEMEQPQSSPSLAGGALSSLKGWMANPLQRAANANPNGIAAKATSFLQRGPLSRGRSAPAQLQVKYRPEDEEFQVLTSSNVLGDDELAALAQFSNANQTPLLSFSGLLRLVRKHPRESFILFTFLLGMFVFFFSRKNSNENDVQ